MLLSRLAPCLAIVSACAEGSASPTSAESTTTSGEGDVSASEGAGGHTPMPSATGSSSSGVLTNPDDPYHCVLGYMPSPPEAIPEGYLPYTCWSGDPECSLWIAQDPERDVAPIEWEPCAPGSPGGEGCRQMARPWPWSAYGAIGATLPGAPRLDTSSGTPMLRLTRIFIDGGPGSYVEMVAGDVDGPARFALRHTWMTPRASRRTPAPTASISSGWRRGVARQAGRSPNGR